jgi:D-sedoheptulose 7-phosphate isomerase
MSDEQFAKDYLNKLHDLLPRLDTARIAETIAAMRKVRDDGKMVYICGNGGSSSIAAQMVVDIVKCASLRKPKRFKMLCLSDSIATLTAYANDEGYDTVFVEPLKNFATEGDMLLAISGSGNSPNVLKAVEYANSVGCTTVGLTTGEGGKLKDAVTIPLAVPHSHMGRLEDCFFVMTHILCYFFTEVE